MTYEEFEDAILQSKPGDWEYVKNGIVLKSNISIFIEYILFDEEVMLETTHLRHRINHFQQASKFWLLYNGNCLYSNWFIVAGPGLSVIALPVMEGESGHGDIEVTPLHAYICYLISPHTCGIEIGKYYEILGIEGIVIEE